MVFNTPDAEPFRAALRKPASTPSGSRSYGDEAWALLEKVRRQARLSPNADGEHASAESGLGADGRDGERSGLAACGAARRALGAGMVEDSGGAAGASSRSSCCFAGVVARYVFHSPLVWSDELASILFLWLAMLGAVVALRRGEHMRMTALVSAWRDALARRCSRRSRSSSCRSLSARS